MKKLDLTRLPITRVREDSKVVHYGGVGIQIGITLCNIQEFVGVDNSIDRTTIAPVTCGECFSVVKDIYEAIQKVKP